MRVLLRFGYSELLNALLGEIFAQGVRISFRLERHVQPVVESDVVLRERHVAGVQKALLARKLVKVGIDEGTGYLPCPVGTEVEEDNAVAFVHGGNGLAAFGNDGGNYEFVGNALVVAVLHSLHGVGFYDAFAVRKRGVRLFHPVPDIVAVHGVESAAYGGYPAESHPVKLLLQFFDIALARLRRDVPAVHEAVDIHVVQPHLLCHFHQSVQVGVVRVHAAVGHESHYVQFFAVRLGAFHSLYKGGIGEEIAVLNGLGNARKFLVDNSARADVEVSHLAVAHLTVGQTHGKAAGVEHGCGIVRKQFKHVGRRFGRYGVEGRKMIYTVAIHNYKTGKTHMIPLFPL